MDLTPIHIRGRKRKHPAALLATKLHSQSTSATTSHASSSQAKRRRKVKATKGTPSPAMPTLQGLPQELLEMVFLYSMNPALPQCSSTLGRTLSSSNVLMEFTMRSFFYTVDHKAQSRNRRSVTSDPHLQSQVLSRRFFTWDFFLRYVERAHDAMVKSRGKAWESTTVSIPRMREFDGLWPFKFTKIPYLGFAEGFYIPEKLLHGPWTKDKASLLYVLVSLNGEIDWAGSLAGETAKSGIKEAIKEENEYAVAALSVLLGVPRALTTDMLRYAVIECNCSVNILRHLLFNAQILAQETSKDSLDFYDAKLWAKADADGEKGGAVKDMLRMADAFDLEFFFDGADWTKIVSFPYGGSKFDTRTTLHAVVRELLMNLYRNYGRKITRRRSRAVIA